MLEKLDGTFYVRLSLSMQVAQMQCSSGDLVFKNLVRVQLTWINHQNGTVRMRLSRNKPAAQS